MRRLLWVAFLACLVSGCYTMLQHPGIQEANAPVLASETERCITCHSAAELDDMAWWLHQPGAFTGVTPLWGGAWYASQPWWWEHPSAPPTANRTSHSQGAALANDRPPLLPLPASVPPPTIRQPAPPETPPVARESESIPPPHAGQPAAGPNPPASEAPHPPVGGARSGASATTPGNPAPQPAPAAPSGGSTPAPPGTPSGTPTPGVGGSTPAPAAPATSPAPNTQGHGLDNDRRPPL
jgi:hypothetical protein